MLFLHLYLLLCLFDTFFFLLFETNKTICTIPVSGRGHQHTDGGPSPEPGAAERHRSPCGSHGALAL